MKVVPHSLGDPSVAGYENDGIFDWSQPTMTESVSTEHFQKQARLVMLGIYSRCWCPKLPLLNQKVVDCRGSDVCSLLRVPGWINYDQLLSSPVGPCTCWFVVRVAVLFHHVPFQLRSTLVS